MTLIRDMRRGWCHWPRRGHTGRSKDPAYKCWENMVQRATNPKATKAHNYVGRGIDVHPTWKHSFIAFIEHIGPRPSTSHSIDRIDNSKGYYPGNVRWATAVEQAKNMRCHRHGGTGIEKHGRWYRFTYRGKVQKYLSWEEAAEAKDNLYGKGSW